MEPGCDSCAWECICGACKVAGFCDVVSAVSPGNDTMIGNGVGGWIWSSNCKDDLRDAHLELICGGRERSCVVSESFGRFVLTCCGVCGVDSQVGCERVPQV